MADKQKSPEPASSEARTNVLQASSSGATAAPVAGQGATSAGNPLPVEVDPDVRSLIGFLSLMSSVKDTPLNLLQPLPFKTLWLFWVALLRLSKL
jgi:hypothetical protein